MISANVDAMLPKTCEVQVEKAGPVNVVFTDGDSQKKLTNCIENLKSTIAINESSIVEAQKAIDMHKKHLDGLNKKLEKYGKSKFFQHKRNRLNKTIENHKNVIENLEKIIVRLKSENENCENMIKNISSVIDGANERV